MRERPTIDYENGLKHCSFCNEWLPLDCFSRSSHKNGGCGLRSYCRACDKVRYPYKPRENPKVQPKQHIFDIQTREELRQCSECLAWRGLPEFFMHGRFKSHLCKPCERTSARERSRQDSERHRQHARDYAKAHPEQVKANLAKWKANNPERVAAHNKNPSKLAKNRAYMQVKSKTPEYRAQQREYDQRTGKGAEKAARRRAVITGVTVEPVDRNAIIKRDRRICYLCGIKVKWREVTLDHVIPLARGGSHTPENLRVACGRCNFSKRDRPIGQLSLI